MNAVLSAQTLYELSANHILNVSKDFKEGVELDYLVTRLYLLNVKVNVDDVRKLIWVLIAQGRLELTVERKLKFIQYY